MNTQLPPPQTPRRPHGPPLSIKAFGRTDFERFDQEEARGSQVCVGRSKIDKIEVDCKYYWKRAQWGVLGDESLPAAIVYIDISFKQLPGCFLQEADVFVTLSDNRYSYAKQHKKYKKATSNRSGSSTGDHTVSFAGNLFGPRKMVANRIKRQAKETETRIMPEIEAAGVKVGGVGHKAIIKSMKEDHWSFGGSVGQPENETGYRTLHWELRENSLEHKPNDRQEYSTAFTFEHGCKPVYMRVEISGKLRSKTQRWKRKFATCFGDSDQSTLTLIDLGNAHRFTKRLDSVAYGLDKAMELENWKKTPVEMPASMPVQFLTDNQTLDGMQDEGYNHDPVAALIEEAERQQDPVLRVLAQGLQDPTKATRTATRLTTSAGNDGSLGVPIMERTRHSAISRPPLMDQQAEQSSEEPSSGTSQAGQRTRSESTSIKTMSSDNSSTTLVEPRPELSVITEEDIKKLVRGRFFLLLMQLLMWASNYFNGRAKQAYEADQKNAERKVSGVTGDSVPKMHREIRKSMSDD